jgi:hypothetical protein
MAVHKEVGIASPSFWIMVADSLLKRLKESGYYTIGYVDDFAILVKGEFIGKCLKECSLV